MVPRNSNPSDRPLAPWHDDVFADTTAVILPGLDESVRGSVQGAPHDDDGGDDQDPERDRRGENPTPALLRPS